MSKLIFKFLGYCCWMWYFKMKPWLYHHTTLKINQRKIDKVFAEASKHD